MRTFGPFYPPRLQLAVSHAERVAHLISAHEAAPPPGDEWARAWLTGRAGEIESLVAEAARAWRRGDLAEQDAAASIDRYLGALHEGMRRVLGLSAPRCCEGSLDTTALVGLPLARVAAEPAPTQADTADAGVSIDDLLDGMLSTHDLR